MGWITNGSLEGIYTLGCTSSYNRFMCTYRYLTEKENGYIKAVTYKTTEAVARTNDWSKFRLVYVENAKANSNATSIAWYNIMAIHGYANTELGSNSFGHRLAPCYSSSLFVDHTNDDKHRRTTFAWDNDGTANSTKWGFWLNDNGDYYIVNRASWAHVGTSSSTGNIEYLISGQTINDTYENLVGWAWSKWQSNYDSSGRWKLTRYGDVSVKISGSWKNNTMVYVKISGTWRRVFATYVKVNGTWERM